MTNPQIVTASWLEPVYSGTLGDRLSSDRHRISYFPKRFHMYFINFKHLYPQSQSPQHASVSHCNPKDNTCACGSI